MESPPESSRIFGINRNFGQSFQIEAIEHRGTSRNCFSRGRGGRLVTVFGRGALRHEFAHRMPRLSPSGESIKDDSYGIQSPLSEVYIASRLSLNSLPLGFKKISCFLQLPDKLFDLRNRGSSNLLNKWRTIWVSLGLGWSHSTHSLPLPRGPQNAHGALCFRVVRMARSSTRSARYYMPRRARMVWRHSRQAGGGK